MSAILHRAINYLRQNGWRAFVLKSGEKILGLQPNPYGISAHKYRTWIRRQETARNNLQEGEGPDLPWAPKVSIVVPVFNPRISHLQAMLESVLAQSYPHWELCLAEGNSQSREVRLLLGKYKGRESRISVRYLDQNYGIAGNLNAAVEMASGEYVAFLDQDDLLPSYALLELIRGLQDNPEAELIYSDEDHIEANGRRRYRPRLKPEFSPDLLRSTNYICHWLIFKRDFLSSLGNFQMGFDGSQDYDLILRASERKPHILHLPKILYHWRAHKDSTASYAGNKPAAHENGKRALREHFFRMGRQAKVDDGPYPGMYRVRYICNSNPRITVIIPNRDQSELLNRCINALHLERYPRIEVLIIENGSIHRTTTMLYQRLQKDHKNLRVIEYKGEFNYSAINNFAVRQSKGELCLFLNNDVEPRNEDWLEPLLGHALRSEVGIVGAKLYYPNGTIQHAGLQVDLEATPGLLYRGYPGSAPGYFGNLLVTRNCAAVTGACCLIRTEVFKEVGGFDEAYPMALSDVDLCLKLRQKGYWVVWTPDSEWTHHESATRGHEDSPEKRTRFSMEWDYFKKKWHAYLRLGDPYYPQYCSAEKADFSLDLSKPAKPGRGKLV